MTTMVLFRHPPKLVYDENGQLIEVILDAEDFLAYLRSLASETDWETLPEHLQDAIDRMLIDEVRSERVEALVYFMR
jgi:Fe-S cluster assembly scaffold protein SufB